MEKTQQITTNNKLLYVFVLIIILMLGYIIFKNDISNFFKRKQILAKVNLFNIPKVYLSCRGALRRNPPDDQKVKVCEDSLIEYTSKTNVWKELIKTKKDINCGDFNNQREAFDFYDYVGGETVQYVKQLGITDPNNYGVIYINYKLKCNYDPYGLDTNHDCWPCKSFNY